MEPEAIAVADGPPRALQVLTLGWACLAGLMSVRVYPGLLLFAAVVFSGGVIGVTWCVLVVRRLVRRSNNERLNWRTALMWGVCPATGVLLTALYLSEVPLALRVEVSERALLDLVERVDSAPKVDGTPQLRWPVRAGAIFVRGADVQQRCVFLLTNEAPIFRMYGLVYVRDGGTPEGDFWNYLTTYRHLVGRWWTFEARD